MAYISRQGQAVFFIKRRKGGKKSREKKKLCTKKALVHKCQTTDQRRQLVAEHLAVKELDIFHGSLSKTKLK